MRTDRDWTVLLIGGASGVGKSSLAYPLARHFEIGVTEVDDFQRVLERMTTPEQYPAVHLFRTAPEVFLAFDDERKVQHMIAYATVMAEALEDVIANHLESRLPLVLEGDFLLPSFAAKVSYRGIPAGDRVRMLTLVEPEQAQIEQNFFAREGETQSVRARESWCYGEWLRAESERLGLPVLTARPWVSVLDRALALLRVPAFRSATT